MSFIIGTIASKNAFVIWWGRPVGRQHQTLQINQRWDSAVDVLLDYTTPVRTEDKFESKQLNSQRRCRFPVTFHVNDPENVIFFFFFSRSTFLTWQWPGNCLYTNHRRTTRFLLRRAVFLPAVNELLSICFWWVLCKRQKTVSCYRFPDH